jgi:hypothetical protein
MADYKMVTKWLWDGDYMENVFYFVPDGGGADEIVLLAAEWLEAMFTPIASIIINTVDNQDNEIFSWSGTDWVLVGSFRSEVGGSATTADILPRQVAAVIIGKTATPRSQGRKFIGGLVNSVQSAGQLTDAARSTLDDFALAWTSPFTGTAHGLNPGVFHALTHAIIPFVGRRVDQILGTQRKRKHGVGI